MKKQTGFTLIELLLVLAIIGIISAIAIPALLAQRENARNKSSEANTTNILSNFVTAFEACRDNGLACDTASDVKTNVIGSTTSSLVPGVWTTKNPWLTPNALQGYSVIAEGGDSAVDPIAETSIVGDITKQNAKKENQGQVQVGFLPASPSTDPPTAAMMFTTVYLSKPKVKNQADSQILVKSIGVD